MEKNILSEINRIREIMGIQIISEAPAPPIGFLKKILGNIFDAAGTSTIDIEKVIKNVTNNLSQTEIDNIISKILSKQFNDIALQDIDLNKLFKEVLKQADVNTKKIINEITVDLIKNEFPDIHESLKNVPSQIRGLNGLLNNNQQDVYDKVLKLLYNQRKLINDAKDLDPNLKKIILDAYGLNSLPTPSSSLPFIKKNKNLLYDTIREEILKKDKLGQFPINKNEKNLLTNFVDDKIPFSSLDKDLQDKVIFFLKNNNIKIDGKDKKIIQEYFNNLLLSKGYLKNNKVNEIQFYRDVHNLMKKGMSMSEALDELIGESDSKLLNNYVEQSINSFGELEDLIRNAPEVTKSSKFKDWLQNYEILMFDYIKYLRETPFPSLKVFFGKDKFIAETEEKLNIILSKIAKKMDEGQDVTGGDWDSLFNTVVTLNTSPQTRYAAKNWLNANLINNKIFTDEAELADFMKTSEYEELMNAVNTVFRKTISEYTKRVVTSYLRLTIIFNPKILKVFKKEATVPELFIDWMKAVGNLIVWGDPATVNDMRALYALMGTKGIFFDKVIKYVGVQILLIPYLKAWWSETQIFEDIANAKKTLDVLKQACEQGMIEKDECTKVDEYLKKVEIRPTETDIANQVRNWIPILGSTNIDTLVNFMISYYEDSAYKSGLDIATENLFKDWQGKVFPEIQKIETESTKVLEELQQKYSKYDLKFDTEENIRKSIQTLNQIIKNEKDLKDKIAKTPEGFQAWADLNNYTVTTPYDTEDGIGVAYNNDDTTKTPIEFEWKNNTFQP